MRMPCKMRVELSVCASMPRGMPAFNIFSPRALGKVAPGQAPRVRLRAKRRAGQLRLRHGRGLLQQRAAHRLELRQRACSPAKSAALDHIMYHSSFEVGQ